MWNDERDKTESGRGSRTVLCGEEWEFSGESVKNLLSAYNSSYTNRAVGPCSIENMQTEHANSIMKWFSSLTLQ